MHDSPLRVWLNEHDIDLEEAAKICRKKKCDGAYYTLLENDFTLPTMALNVARALNIPPEDAKPMGRAIDKKAWESKAGVEPLDKLNYCKTWYKRIESRNDSMLRPEKVYMNVVEYRRILTERGINYDVFSDEHNRLYRLCRTLSGRHDTRVNHIKDMADLLGVPSERLLTEYATIEQQERVFRTHIEPVQDGIPPDKRMSPWGMVDCEKLDRLIETCGKRPSEIAERFAVLTSGISGRSKNAVRRSYYHALNEAHDHPFQNGWEKLERLAAAIGCKPEDFATRYTHGEFLERRREQARKAMERRYGKD